VHGADVLLLRQRAVGARVHHGPYDGCVACACRSGRTTRHMRERGGGVPRTGPRPASSIPSAYCTPWSTSHTLISAEVCCLPNQTDEDLHESATASSKMKKNKRNNNLDLN
jgi:hypothetical protein